MSSPVQRLRHRLTVESTLYEYRNCGTTLKEQHGTDPHCGAEDIASYDFD